MGYHGARTVVCELFGQGPSLDFVSKGPGWVGSIFFFNFADVQYYSPYFLKRIRPLGIIFLQGLQLRLLECWY